MTHPSRRRPSTTEGLAVKILQAALPGIEVVPVDPGGGSRQLHDFNLVHGDGTVEALEITEATVAQLRSANAARAKQLSSGTVLAPALRRSWHLIPSERTRFNELPKAIPLLVQVEAKIQVDGLEGWDQHPAAQQLYMDFHLEHVRPWGPTSDPKLVVGLAGDLTEWVEDPHDPGYWVQEVVKDKANEPDNRTKLAASGAAERHLFIWVDLDYYLPWKDLDFGRLPITPPHLPTEVTTVWVAASVAGGRCVVWRVRPPGPWHAVPISGPCDTPSTRRSLAGRALMLLRERGRRIWGLLARYFIRRSSA
jgi:hypothetical protein